MSLVILLGNYYTHLHYIHIIKILDPGHTCMFFPSKHDQNMVRPWYCCMWPLTIVSSDHGRVFFKLSPEGTWRGKNSPYLRIFTLSWCYNIWREVKWLDEAVTTPSFKRKKNPGPWSGHLPVIMLIFIVSTEVKMVWIL